MEIVWFVLIGVASGVIAGMGMGGGTLLIPMLTIFMSISQSVSQGVNLVVFIPMAIIVCIIYVKNKLIDFKYFWLLIIPAVLVAVIGSFVSFEMNKDLLQKIFGFFVGGVGLVQLIIFIVCKIKKIKMI